MTQLSQTVSKNAVYLLDNRLSIKRKLEIITFKTENIKNLNESSLLNKLIMTLIFIIYFLKQKLFLNDFQTDLKCLTNLITNSTNGQWSSVMR